MLLHTGYTVYDVCTEVSWLLLIANLVPLHLSCLHYLILPEMVETTLSHTTKFKHYHTTEWASSFVIVLTEYGLVDTYCTF